MSGALPSAPPPSVPVVGPPRAWHRRLCRWIVLRAGWRLEGTLPDVAKVILVGAPHSSFWDGVWGMLMKTALGLRIGIMIKAELFRGPLGWLLRKLDAIPVQRKRAFGVVEQMVRHFADSDALWLGITPEGTRRAVVRWRSGFWQIARGAQVPVLLVYLDYPSKTIGLGPLWHMGPDLDAEMARIRAFYAPYRGKHRGV
jgi:1-acyl-sn-glycerol-3-phosphate acyltransferase